MAHQGEEATVRVVAIAAITADGMIARGPDHPVTWSSKEDKRMFAAASRRAGVIVMGRSTYEAMPKPLADRLQIVMTSTPERFTGIAGQVEFTAHSPEKVLADLEQRGFREVVVGGGGAIYHAFIAAGLVDELWLTVEPLLFGAGVSLLGGQTVEAQLRLLEVVHLSAQAVQLKYAMERGHVATQSRG